MPNFCLQALFYFKECGYKRFVLLLLFLFYYHSHIAVILVIIIVVVVFILAFGIFQVIHFSGRKIIYNLRNVESNKIVNRKY